MRKLSRSDVTAFHGLKEEIMRAVIRRSGRPTPTVGWRLAEREDGWPFNSDKENEPSPDATSHTKSADRVASLSFPAAPGLRVPIGGFAAVRNDKGIDQADSVSERLN